MESDGPEIWLLVRMTREEVHEGTKKRRDPDGDVTGAEYISLAGAGSVLRAKNLPPV
jgi:hypothetical protein